MEVKQSAKSQRVKRERFDTKEYLKYAVWNSRAKRLREESYDAFNNQSNKRSKLISNNGTTYQWYRSDSNLCDEEDDTIMVDINPSPSSLQSLETVNFADYFNVIPMRDLVTPLSFNDLVQAESDASVSPTHNVNIPQQAIYEASVMTDQLLSCGAESLTYAQLNPVTADSVDSAIRSQFSPMESRLDTARQYSEGPNDLSFDEIIELIESHHRIESNSLDIDEMFRTSVKVN